MPFQLVLFALILSLITNTLCCQNLVPNYSFEEVLECPEPNDLMVNCVGWISSRETADHYHACAESTCIQTPAGVCFGYQVPLEGEGFGAFTTMRTVEWEFKEHIACQLLEPLEVGTEYFLSFNVVRSNKEHFALASNNQGALFTTYMLDDENEYKSPVANFAHINNEVIIEDTLNWVQIRGSFIADSAYTYMALGNFFDEENTDTLHLGPEIEEAFYAVDVVRLSSDSLYAYEGIINGTQDQYDFGSGISVFPIPMTSFVTVNSSKNLIAIRVTDMSARVVFQDSFAATQKVRIDLSALGGGIYVVEGVHPDGTHTRIQTLKQ